MTIEHRDIEQMKRVAKGMSEKAYCPYSKFHVGAAVMDAHGEIRGGCNVENASYGLVICAERNAIFRSVAQGVQAIIAVVVYTPTPEPSPPCGACRQVINEFGPNARVYSFCDGDGVIDRPLNELLPFAFGPQNLA